HEIVGSNLKNETEIQTEIELEQWLKDNCYPMTNYSINGNSIFEGFILENNSRFSPYFEWIYTERGEKRSLAEFYNEKEAVQFALKKIQADEHSNRNFIGMYEDRSEEERILAELKNRGIKYWT